MTPLGQARAQRAWRGLHNAPIYTPSDAFYVAMWEQDQIERLMQAKLQIQLLAPMGADLEAVGRIQRQLYMASSGRYSAPEERISDLKERETRLTKELRELREQIALAEN